MAAARPAVVGGFILGALALGVAAILFFGGSRLFASTSRAVVFFEGSVAGLELGAPVTFRGVRVGSVQHVALHFSADSLTARIPIFLEIEPDRVIWEGRGFPASEAEHRRLVQAGLRAQLALQSFVTGQLRVDLDFRPGTPEHLVGAVPGVPEIPAVPSDLDRLRNTVAEVPLRELAEAALHAFGTVDGLAGRLDTALDPLVESARRTAGAATQTLETANEAVHRVQMDASATLRGLDALAADARRQLDAGAGELGRTLATVDRAGRQAETLLASLNGMAAPRSPFRTDLEAASRDVAASAGSLRSFARSVERDPSALLTGRASR
jgi:paraquat-inducible protein B